MNDNEMYKNLLHGDIKELLDQCDKAIYDEWKGYFQGFENLFSNYIESKPLEWSKIKSPSSETVIPVETLQETDNNNLKTLLNKLVVIKLNGGLGTTMGCEGPKSLIKVRDDMTFLDITIKQLEYLNQKYDTNVPLILMNSFNTDADTKKVLYKYENCRTKIHCFKQSQYPRIFKESNRPLNIVFDENDKSCWYPPGHGNFYEAFKNSGLLEQFLKESKSVAFVSNIDNLGATIDIDILNSLVNARGSGQPYEYVIEVTEKTKADIKGGTIIDYEGKPRLLEIAQVPKNHEEDFKSVKKFKIFNTNNIWVNLKSIENLLKNNDMNLDVIVNQKSLDNGINIIQLETAIGAAINNFKNAVAVCVPRSRFLPVKNNSDLLLIKSNLYSINKGNIIMNPKRQFATTPFVKFSGSGFIKVGEFLQRFGGMPDILELDHLTVSGDVTFGSDVVFKGTVIIIAQHGERIDIPSGSVFENKIVAGNLRIISH